MVKEYSDIGYIRLQHFSNKPVRISYALSAIAAQENCDSEEYDLMQAASEYIKWLEAEIDYSGKSF